MEKVTEAETLFLWFYITLTRREVLYLRLTDVTVIINIKKLGAFEPSGVMSVCFFPSYLADIHRGGK